MITIPFCMTSARATRRDHDPADDGTPLLCPTCHTLAPVKVQRFPKNPRLAVLTLQPHIPAGTQIPAYTGSGRGIGFESAPATDIPTTATVRFYTVGEMQPAELLTAVDRLYYDHEDHPDYVAWREASTAQHGLEAAP